MEKINEPKYWFFQKISKIDTLWVTKGKKKILITKIRNKRTGITIELAEIERIIREYYEQHLHANKLDKPNEMEKFPEKLNSPQIRIRKCAPTLESSLTVSQNVKHKVTMWSCISLLSIYTEMKMCPHKNNS